jgi:hypothetical protein
MLRQLFTVTIMGWPLVQDTVAARATVAVWVLRQRLYFALRLGYLGSVMALLYKEARLLFVIIHLINNNNHNQAF